MSNCDIIIPVYNAFDAVKECVESVLKNTDFRKAHLILIDDKSPDERILPLLRKFAKEHQEEITLLINDENLGFVGTVNRGMKYSKNDVLLLNSDTEVPGGWLDRIIDCAYSDEKIATVTPLSNNATLASVPKIFYRNELPEGMSLAEMDQVVNDCSMKLFPEIPTAHGFCMFIKREALDKVGFFDEENFGKGYGEENDFSFRCFEFGYRNVLCDNVYVLHKESQSFLENKVDNSAALQKKHPALKSGLDVWCRVRDIRKVGDNIALAIGLRQDRPNILFVIHDFSNIEENVGGTTLHILDLIRNLRGKFNIHVLSVENGLYKVHSFFEKTDVVTDVYEKPILIEPVGLYSNTYKIMIERILEKYQISFIHIHHMLWHFFDLGRVAKERKIEYAVSLHDFYLETPVPSMMDKKVANKVEAPLNLDVWHEACRGLLSGAKYVFAPSEFVKEEYLKTYNGLKIEVIRHGIDVEKVLPKGDRQKKQNIAFVGAVFPHKGSEILLDLSEKIDKNDELKIHLFGMTTADIRKKDFFENHGKYKRVELPRLLQDNEIDLVCAFSLAPETYAYTVDEAAASGVPVLTFDIGAGAERVRDNNLGWVMEYTKDTDQILAKIKQILRGEAEYDKKIKAIADYKIKSTKKMADEYSRFYEKNTQKKKLNFKEMQDGIFKVDFLEVILATRGDSINYYDDYMRVINSARWRMLSKIQVPHNIRKTLKKFYHKIRK